MRVQQRASTHDTATQAVQHPGTVRLGHAGQARVPGCPWALGAWGVVRSGPWTNFAEAVPRLSTCPGVLRACLLGLGNTVAIEKKWVPPEIGTPTPTLF